MQNRAPYDQLHIYIIEGDARSQAPAPGGGYLGLWLEDKTSFLFFEAPAEKEVQAILAGDPSLQLSDRIQMSYEEWQGGLDLEPIELPGLSVVPAWAEYSASPGQKVLRLDPGLVFGNGLHPTTRHCLELLRDRAQAGPLGRVLDLGCGTGILALAAAALGADWVLAVDLNPLCISTTQKNAALNRLELQTAEGPAQDFLGQAANLVLANLHYEAQLGLWSGSAGLEDKEDILVSGITRSQVADIKQRLERLGYKLQQEREAESTWFTLWYARS